jgi:hypothetical protein
MIDEFVGHQTDSNTVAFVDWFVTVHGHQHLCKTSSGWWICGKNVMGMSGRCERIQSHGSGQVCNVTMSWPWSSFQLVGSACVKQSQSDYFCSEEALPETHAQSGIAVPKTVCDTMQLDQENSNNHWMDAAALEIVTVGIAFKQLSDRDNVPIGYQFI